MLFLLLSNSHITFNLFSDLWKTRSRESEKRGIILQFRNELRYFFYKSLLNINAYFSGLLNDDELFEWVLRIQNFYVWSESCSMCSYVQIDTNECRIRILNFYLHFSDAGAQPNGLKADPNPTALPEVTRLQINFAKLYITEIKLQINFAKLFITEK